MVAKTAPQPYRNHGCATIRNHAATIAQPLKNGHRNHPQPFPAHKPQPPQPVPIGTGAVADGEADEISNPVCYAESPCSEEAKSMSVRELIDIIEALAWPLTAVGIVAVFQKSVRAVLDRLAATLTLRSVKLKAFNVEIELSPELAERAWEKLLQNITESTNELSKEEKALFEQIRASAGQATVIELLPDFKRDTPVHIRLQNLRDRQLIRSIEGGSWKAEKHPILTRFGETIRDLEVHAASPAAPAL
jgi:hypothetical protein